LKKITEEKSKYDNDLLNIKIQNITDLKNENKA
jgi:hypothetical protein